jgi:hypothetical protein
MSYFPPPSSGENKEAPELIYRSAEEIIIPENTLLADPIELAKWKLTKPSGTEDVNIALLESNMKVLIKRTAGAGAVAIKYNYSSDGINWADGSLAQTGSAVYVNLSSTNTEQTLTAARLYLRVILYCTTGTTAGAAKNIAAYFKMILPAGVTLERLI